MGTRLSIRAPLDYRIGRDVCSYGYFLLAPDEWDVGSQSLGTVLDLSGGPCSMRIAQSSPGSVVARCERALSRGEQAQARGLVTRMLRLDESEEELRAFHAVDPRWKASGRGRLFRSPTLFQDIVRTVTSCNVAWPSTVNMNRRMCEVLGRGGAFPSSAKMSRTRAGTLRARCRVGYRDRRLIELARLFERGQIDERWLTDPGTSDDEAFRFLVTLPGVGPYAAANIMQLIGRYSRVAIDTESVRHGRSVLGLEGEDAEVMTRVRDHYERFGSQRFRSYWFELWTDYEGRHGPANLWEPREKRTAFTAAKLKAGQSRG